MSTVLVVDDNLGNRYLLQTLLKGYGYGVVAAGNGVEALEMARLSPPDIVISDILMPVMDGFAFCRQWRGDDRLKAIPFVFYTATYTDPKDEEFALSLGADRFIVKPQEPEEIARITREVLEDSRAGRLAPSRVLAPEDAVYYKQYNEALVRKLEDKVEQLEKANRELASNNEDLRQFAHVASHHLQEPLRTVACCVQLLTERYKGRLDANADEFIGYAVEGVAKMYAMIESVRQYVSVEAFGKPLERVSCESAFSQAMVNLADEIKRSKAEITHDPLPDVMGDSVQLRQVFSHLVGNAIKFRGEDPPRVHVSAERREGEWVIAVKDNGIGIEPRFSERIFDLFERLELEDGRPGVGIGLPICRRMIRRHGGRIWVESKPGSGSVFSFTLPVIKGD